LAAHLSAAGFEPSLWVTKWLLCLFTYDLQFEMVLRIWDVLIAEGFLFIFKLGLTLVQNAKENLVKSDLEKIVNIMREYN
jgi:hypothetical protein